MTTEELLRRVRALRIDVDNIPTVNDMPWADPGDEHPQKSVALATIDSLERDVESMAFAEALT